MSNPNEVLVVSGDDEYDIASAADSGQMISSNFSIAGSLDDSLPGSEIESLSNLETSLGKRKKSTFELPEVPLGSDTDDVNSSELAGTGNKRRRKKHRLSVGQVFFLEKSFEVSRRLHPERKLYLANELGLKPKQVQVWFQNRRARFKNKQIEKEYDKITGKYCSIKNGYDSVVTENKNLKAEVEIMRTEIDLLKNSLRRYKKLNSGLMKARSQQAAQPQVVMQPQQPDQVMQTQSQLIPDYNHLYANNNNVGNVRIEGMFVTEIQVQQQQQALSPISSVFDSNSPGVPNHIPVFPLGNVPVFEPGGSNLVEADQDNSVNQDSFANLCDMFDLGNNCFYTLPDSPAQTPASAYPVEFGVMPTEDDQVNPIPTNPANFYVIPTEDDQINQAPVPLSPSDFGAIPVNADDLGGPVPSPAIVPAAASPYDFGVIPTYDDQFFWEF